MLSKHYRVQATVLIIYKLCRKPTYQERQRLAEAEGSLPGGYGGYSNGPTTSV